MNESVKAITVNIILTLFCVLVLSRTVMANPSSHLTVAMGELSTKIVGPWLKEFAQTQTFFSPSEIETEGKAKGYKYRARVKDLVIENLFLNLPGDTYSIKFDSNGQILFHCHLPNTKISGSLRLKGLSQGLFSDLATIKREYSINLVGLNTDVLVRVGLVSGQIRVLDSQLANINFGKPKLKLIKENDGAGAYFVNSLSNGSIDRMVENLILKQLQGQQLLQTMTVPVQRLVERLVIPGSFVIDSPLGIETKAEIISITTGLKMMTQKVGVNFGATQNDTMTEMPEYDSSQMDLPGPNEMHILIPMLFIKNMAGVLNQRGIFSHSGEKFGVKFQITPGSDITMESVERNNEIHWRVPINIDLDSHMASGQMSGVILVKARTRIDPDGGIFLELVESKLIELDTGKLPMGSIIRGIANKLLELRIAEAFPKAPLMATKIPVGSDVELNITRLETGTDALKAFGTLQRIEPADRENVRSEKQNCNFLITKVGPVNRAKWVRVIYSK